MTRGEEPADLKKVRDARLKELRELIQREKRDPKSKEITGYGLPSVRESLFNGQGKKCCYCEGPVEGRFDPVEHYRPKTLVARDGTTPERPGYWWLAFSWENLLFSCPYCNGEKLTKFPLHAGSSPLSAEDAPPGPEKPHLLDPYDTSPDRDPVALIEFRRTTERGKETWRAFPRNGDVSARRTIEDIVRLNRDGLSGKYREHVQKVVIPKADSVKNALRGEALKMGDVRPLWNAYVTTARSLLRPDATFSALSYDALRFLVPDNRLLPHIRRGWPRPPYKISVLSSSAQPTGAPSSR